MLFVTVFHQSGRFYSHAQCERRGLPGMDFFLAHNHESRSHSESDL
jgi:hypothetical protein